MKVLVTRAEPAATLTTAKLEKLEHYPVKIPLFEIVDTGAKLPETEFNGVVLTSQNAVHVVKNRGWKPENIDVPAFCVGKRTSEYTQSYGFNNVINANGSVKELATLISRWPFESDPSLLYLTTADRKPLLEELLLANGLVITPIEIYKSAPLQVSKNQLSKTLDEIENGAVLLYSEKSANHLRDLLLAYDLQTQINNVCAIAISSSTGDVVADLGWQQLLLANQPNESSMFYCLESCKK